jgi:hypothetical protein
LISTYFKPFDKVTGVPLTAGAVARPEVGVALAAYTAGTRGPDGSTKQFLVIAVAVDGVVPDDMDVPDPQPVRVSNRTNRKHVCRELVRGIINLS